MKLRLERIVLGYDGSGPARDALALAAALAGSEDAEVTALIGRERPRFPLSLAARRDSAAESALATEAEELLGAGRSRVRIVDGSPAGALRETAGSEDADLIVLGRTHHGAIARRLSGGIAEELLERSACPLAVAPSGFARREHLGLGIIGAAYDGSPEAKLALVAAERLALLHDAELRLLGLFRGPAPGIELPAYEATSRSRMETMLEAAETALRSASAGRGVQARCSHLVLEGEPAKLLREQQVELDLLVAGSRGRGRPARTVLGSLSAELLADPVCPVIIVPHAALERELAGAAGEQSAA